MAMRACEVRLKKILIVGDKGRMGGMLLQRARNIGLHVLGIDQPLEQTELEEKAQGVSLAVFCVPAPVFAKVLERVCPHLPKNCIVSDITSVKELPMEAMEGIWPGSFVGTHPLFGPEPDSSGPLPVAITPGRQLENADLDFCEAFWTSLGFTVFRCTPKEHDVAMAKIQNLNFITNLAYFALLAGQTELYPYLTPSFRRRLASARKMLTEDASMFSALFEANRNSHEVVRNYSRILNLAASGDIGLLCERAKSWWPEAEADKKV